MRKILQIVSASIVGACLMAGVASAATNDCNIVNGNGDNSNNTCVSTENNDLTITCKNDTDVVYVNGQSANSGNVTLNSNGNAGYTYSGNAVNTVNDSSQLDVKCGPVVAVTPTTPTTTAPTPTTATPAPTTPVATPAPKVSALPETGSNTAVDAVLIGVAALGGSMFASRLGVLAYRRHSLK